jgi:hypothetical protein
MNIALFILAALCCYMVVVPIHELGHLIAGLSMGFRFEKFVLGPVGIKRNPAGKLRFYLEKNPALWGGCAATVPTRHYDNIHDRFARILIAGPIMSLLVGIVMLTLFSITKSFLLLLAGAMSFGIGMATLIPMRAGVFYSDGGRWLRIKRKGPEAEIEIAIINIVQSYYVHGDYHHISPRHIDVLVQDADPRNQFMGHFYGMQAATNDEARAVHASQLDALKPLMPKNFVQLFEG